METSKKWDLTVLTEQHQDQFWKAKVWDFAVKLWAKSHLVTVVVDQ